jgi:hypothetical protein
MDMSRGTALDGTCSDNSLVAITASLAPHLAPDIAGEYGWARRRDRAMSFSERITFAAVPPRADGKPTCSCETPFNPWTCYLVG